MADQPAPAADADPKVIGAYAAAQRVKGDREIIRSQLRHGFWLIIIGLVVTIGALLIVPVNEAVKLTAIVSIGTAAIGAGAAMLPTGAAAGAAARILNTLPPAPPQTAGDQPSPPPALGETGRSGTPVPKSPPEPEQRPGAPASRTQAQRSDTASPPRSKRRWSRRRAR